MTNKRQFSSWGSEIEGRNDLPPEQVHCWYVVQVDEADNAYLGWEGPFWAEEELDEFLRKCRLRRGVLDVICVPEEKT